ncbi:hypothetical protein B0H19DRAFT_1257813 [Mycena capillaripes]|nr:hypothetical protein B0H19DRAFT_1257813 [Mycena capillaripes]
MAEVFAGFEHFGIISAWDPGRRSLGILGIWSKGLEKLVVFAFENQKTASFLVTATATTLCTVYSAVLVFVTQTLSMRRDLHTNQFLATTHDTAAAWSGVESAMFSVWRQRAVPASTFAVVSVLVYLGSILVLHVTASSLISLETFNATSPMSVPTEGLPAFNLSHYNLLDAQDRSAVWSNTLNYAAGSLMSLMSTLLQPLSKDVIVTGMKISGTLEGGPILLAGNATVLVIVPQLRLNLSIIAVAAGLAASVSLSIVSLRFLHFRDDEMREDDVFIDGTGILQAMWLYRNHPELESILKHVEEPTNDNLRQAAVVKTRLADGPEKM